MFYSLTVFEIFDWRFRPSDPDRMTIAALEAISSLSGIFSSLTLLNLRNKIFDENESSPSKRSFVWQAIELINRKAVVGIVALLRITLPFQD